jgi:hypothetical protein
MRSGTSARAGFAPSECDSAAHHTPNKKNRRDAFRRRRVFGLTHNGSPVGAMTTSSYIPKRDGERIELENVKRVAAISKTERGETQKSLAPGAKGGRRNARTKEQSVSASVVIR